VKIQSALADLDAKILAEVEFAHIWIAGYLFCGAAGEQEDDPFSDVEACES